MGHNVGNSTTELYSPADSPTYENEPDWQLEQQQAERASIEQCVDHGLTEALGLEDLEDL